MSPLAISFFSLPQLVASAFSAAQSVLPSLSNTGPGGAIAPFVNAAGAVGQQNQATILQFWQASNILTAQGADLDAWVAQYVPGGFIPRLPPTNATGHVTFAQTASYTGVLIPLGTVVKSSDGTQNYAVTEDDSNALWTSSQGGYLIPQGTLTITVPVQAATAGSAANVIAGAITTISATIQANLSVTNAVALTNGVDAESDAALRVRFYQFFKTRPGGTTSALQYAISSVQQAVSSVILKNTLPDLSTKLGYTFIAIDDGTGSPPQTLIDEVYAAVSAVSGASLQFDVSGPNVVDVDVSMTIYVNAGYTKASVGPLVQTAITSLINGLGIGNSLYLGKLYATAQGVEGVNYVDSMLVNGVGADLAAGPIDSIRALSVAVN